MKKSTKPSYFMKLRNMKVVVAWLTVILIVVINVETDVKAVVHERIGRSVFINNTGRITTVR